MQVREEEQVAPGGKRRRRGDFWYLLTVRLPVCSEHCGQTYTSVRSWSAAD